MSETPADDLMQEVSELYAASAKKKRVLAQLLDEYSEPKGRVFALKTEMGFTAHDTGQAIRVPSFLVTQTLDWIGKYVKLGSQMPFMSSYIDATGHLKVDETNAETVKQRAPDWTRQASISAYLAHDARRKFGTIVGVLSPSWVDDPQHEYWGPSGGERRALRSAYKFEALDSKGRIGLLDLDGVNIYALDGQHRVMGIRGLQDLREYGVLDLKNRFGKATSTAIKREEFLELFRLDLTQFQTIFDETMSIELVPAVLAGESFTQASQRIRSVFITTNRYAVSPGKSETTLLNESDGFAILARNAAIHHPLFKGTRVDWKKASLPRSSECYTTLQTIRDMAHDYLMEIDADGYRAWQPYFNEKQVPIRPAEDEIENARKVFFELLDNVHELPVFRRLEGGDSVEKIRLFPGETEESGPLGHLLLRPVGQIILSRSVGALVRKGRVLKEIFEDLSRWDEAGGFSQHPTESIWFGVTYKDGKMGTRTNEELASRLLQYMVVGGSEEERTALARFIVEQRQVAGSKPQWMGFDGELHTFDPENPAEGVHLPRPIDPQPG